MSTIDHPDNSSPHAEDSTYQPDPETPTDVLPPPGPHVQQVRGAPGAAAARSKQDTAKTKAA